MQTEMRSAQRIVAVALVYLDFGNTNLFVLFFFLLYLFRFSF